MIGQITKRSTLPPTGRAKVDKAELKLQLVKGGMEMDECIDKGTLPVFGYPLVCYSPIEENTKEMTQSDRFWQIMFKSTMQTRPEG